jgi:AcrR family transcriptional regulator
MIEKTDRRFQRTRKLLMDALIALAQRNGYDAVTIRDITTYADISYSTFFRHYQDKDELLMSIIQNAVEEMRALMQNLPSGASEGQLIFQHVAENQPLYRVLLGGLNSSAMVQRVQDMIVREILRGHPIESVAGIPPDVAANHIAASGLAMVKWWLDNDMPYSPERMGTFYARLIMKPFEHPTTGRISP